MTRKEPTVHTSPELRLRMVNERIARGHRFAARARLAEEARRRHRPSLRRSVGRSMISIGRRLVAEQSLTPVRSR
jgi:hypothetical protein